MFTVGMSLDSRGYFMSSTMLISLPTGCKLYNWLCTYLKTYHIYQESCVVSSYIQMFLLMFTLGGSTGIILGNIVVDICLHDSYYVVCHFHVVLSLGTLIVIIISILYYQEFIFVL
jgi:cytochrome c oxidase subunit 1